MKTLNQIKNILETIATNHKQINSFGFGDIWEYDIKKFTHPIMWRELKGASVDASVKRITINFSFWFMDLVNKDERNELDVLSDQLLIATDVISTLGLPEYDDDFIISEQSNMENFTEKEDTEVSGWKVDVSFQIPFLQDTCNIPTV